MCTYYFEFMIIIGIYSAEFDQYWCDSIINGTKELYNDFGIRLGDKSFKNLSVYNPKNYDQLDKSHNKSLPNAVS